MKKDIKKLIFLSFVLVSIFSTSSLAYNLENHYIANKSTQYKWGANMTSNGIIKNGWLAAVDAWNAEGMNIRYSSNSRNLLESRYRDGYSENGMSIITPYDSSSYSTVKEFVCYMNSSKTDWNSTTARSTGTHEIGHVIGLGHSNAYYSIMRDNRNREEISTIQADDRNGYRAIYN